MFTDFMSASLAANKIITLQAKIQNSEIEYNELIDEYNALVRKSNKNIDTIKDLRKQIQEHFSNNPRIQTLQETISDQENIIESLREEVEDKEELIQKYKEEFANFNRERNLRMVTDQTIIRILEEIPEEDRMRAMAKVMARYPPEKLNYEFNIDYGDEIEEIVQAIAIFAGGVPDPEKYQMLKKDAGDALSYE